MIIERYIIDRIEEGILVMTGSKDESVLEAPSKDFTEGFREGDVVYVSFDDEGNISDIKADRQETKRIRNEMKKKMKSLFDN